MALTRANILAVMVTALALGCNDGTPGPDAGNPGDIDHDLPDSGTDAGDPGDAGFDAGTDAGFDAGTDAGLDASTDAGTDAGLDAGPDAGVDAGTDAGSDAGSILVGVWHGSLVHLEPTTAALRLRGPTGYVLNRPVWDTRAGVLRVLVNNTTAPQLGTMDPCTGQVTLGPRARRPDGGLLIVAEAIAQAPDGAIWVTVDLDTSSSTVSERLGPIDLDSGVVAPEPGTLNTIDTGDGDFLFFTGTRLVVIDGSPFTNDTAAYQVDAGVVTATLFRLGTAVVSRFGYDPTRATLFGWNSVTRALEEVQFDGGRRSIAVAITNPSLDAGLNADGGAFLDSLAWMPRPSCP